MPSAADWTAAPVAAKAVTLLRMITFHKTAYKQVFASFSIQLKKEMTLQGSSDAQPSAWAEPLGSTPPGRTSTPATTTSRDQCAHGV